MSKLDGLKGFIVRYEAEAIVMARDEKHAKQIMEDPYNSDWYKPLSGDLEIGDFSHIPGRWGEDDLVYHEIEGSDVSVTEAWSHHHKDDEKVDPNQMNMAFDGDVKDR